MALALSEQATAAIHNARLLLRSTERQNRRLGPAARVDARHQLERGPGRRARHRGAHRPARLLGAEQCQIQDYDGAANTVTPVAFWQRHDGAARARQPAQGRTRWTTSPTSAPFSRPSRSSSSCARTRQLARPTRDDDGQVRRSLLSEHAAGVRRTVVRRDGARRDRVRTALERRGRRPGRPPSASRPPWPSRHARLYRRVQDQAITDGLTGLYNHRYFYERLEQEIARARRYGTPVSLLMIDLDDFKAFNDRRGHPAGDAVLREPWPRCSRSELRAQARHRGALRRRGVRRHPAEHADAPVSDADGDGPGRAKLTEMRTPTHRLPPATATEPSRWPSASAGAWPPPNSLGATRDGRRDSRSASASPCSRCERNRRKTSSPHADAALYKAKRSGKNRVESYG